jgi:peptidylprolyl isomerase
VIRRLLPVAAVLVAAVGCGTQLPTVQGDFGMMPSVDIPSIAAPDEPVVKVLLTGKGRQLARTDVAVVNVAIWTWRQGKPYLDTYRTRQPTSVRLGGDQVSRAWDAALVGKRAGSRVLLVAPAKLGFGKDAIAPANVEPSDTLVLVFDVVGGYRATRAFEPALKLPASQPPAALRTVELRRGTGPVARRGSTVVLHYTGVTWPDAALFDSSYRRGAPNGFVLEPGAVPPGWLDALAGLPAGSSVLVSVPASLGKGFTATPGGLVVPPGAAVCYRLDLIDVAG